MSGAHQNHETHSLIVLAAHRHTHTLSHSPSGVWLSMPLSVWLEISLTSSLVPHPSPTHPPTQTRVHNWRSRTKPALFPICHPPLSRQQCRLSKVLVIDCYCNVGRALRCWVSDDCSELHCWVGERQLFGYSAPFVACKKDLTMQQSLLDRPSQNQRCTHGKDRHHTVWALRLTLTVTYTTHEIVHLLPD